MTGSVRLQITRQSFVACRDLGKLFCVLVSGITNDALQVINALIDRGMVVGTFLLLARQQVFDAAMVLVARLLLSSDLLVELGHLGGMFVCRITQLLLDVCHALGQRCMVLLMAGEAVEQRSVLRDKGSLLVMRDLQSFELLHLPVGGVAENSFHIVDAILQRSMQGIHGVPVVVQIGVTLLQILQRSPKLLAGCESAMQITQLGMRLLDLFVVLVCGVIQYLLQVINALLQRSMVRLELSLLCCQASMTLLQV